MTREEFRAKAVDTILDVSLGIGFNATDKDAEYILDSLGAAGFKVLGTTYTEEMCIAGMNSYSEPLTAYDAIATAGDLTRKQE